MPQFELANFLPQMFWLAIFFAILYFVVVRPTLPKLGRVMTQREDQVAGDIDRAAKAKAEADRIAAAHDQAIAEAQTTARGKVGEAQAKAAAALERKLKASNDALAAEAQAAQASLSAARANAMGDIETVAAEAAADIVEKLTGTRPSPAAARAALA